MAYFKGCEQVTEDKSVHLLIFCIVGDCHNQASLPPFCRGTLRAFVYISSFDNAIQNPFRGF